MGRPPCCDKSNVKRGLWTPEEDKKILAYVSTHGAGNWASVPRKAGLKRCGKSCRLRWTNYLRPDLKHDDFTLEEEQMITTLHSQIGSRWSIIAQQLPGRTDNDVKNYWNTKLKKKLIQRGIDPVTHRPISHVFNSIQGLSRGCNKSSTSTIGTSSKNSSATLCHKQKDFRVSCLSRDLRNVFMTSMPEPPLDTGTDIAESSSHMQQGVTYDYKPAWDLLAQLHAVKLVADASKQMSTTPLSHFTHGEPPPASYSFFDLAPPQQEAVAAAAAALPEFNWRDFILRGVSPPFVEDESQAYTSHAGTSSNPLPGEVLWGESTTMQGELAEIVGGSACCSGTAPTERSGMAGCSSYATGEDVNCVAEEAPRAPSPSDIDSFVESLLSRDEEIMWAFPEFLGNPFG